MMRIELGGEAQFRDGARVVIVQHAQPGVVRVRRCETRRELEHLAE